MDIILGQKDVLGFDGLTDICAGGSPPAVCDLGGFANDFTVTSAISTEGSWSENGNVKMITVNIGGLGYASLNTLVARS